MRDFPLLIAVFGIPFAGLIGVGAGVFTLSRGVKRTARQLALLVALLIAPAVAVFLMPERLGSVRFSNAGLAGLSAFLSTFVFVLAFLATVLLGTVFRRKPL